MLTTISTVLRQDKDLNEFLINACSVAQKNGGYFSIRQFFKDNWFNEYLISFPSKTNGEGEIETDEAQERCEV